ncbi:MAG: diacylglycerol kinase family protein [Crocinitomicaceae bacterium]|nr:diacylglycerol kinase family protein [Crocinitomicaceae bacterium]
MSKWSLKNRIKSFSHAFRGLSVFGSEPHLIIHLIAAICVITAGIIVGLSPMKLVVLILTIVIVISLELINTALEKLIDKLHPERDPVIGKVKDIMAASVLVAAMGAVVVGVLVFFY